MKCIAGISDDFHVEVGVHQGSVLSPLLFITPLDYLLKTLEDDPEVQEFLFADDGAIVSAKAAATQRALDGWSDVLEGNGYRISDAKTKHLFCPFSDPDQCAPDIYLHGKVLDKCDKFDYLGSTINKTADCNDDVNHRVSVGWMKWRENSAIFCDRRMPPALKGRLHTSAVRPALAYGSQAWTSYKNMESKVNAAEMKMLRMAARVTKRDKIRSTRIRASLHIKNTIVEKIENDRLNWYCHVQRRDPENPVRKAISANVPAKRRRGRPKHSWLAQMQKRQQQLGDQTIQDRQACRRVTRSQTTANPTCRPAGMQ